METFIKNIFYLPFLFSFFIVKAQNLDSLENSLKQNQSDTAKANTYLLLAKKYNSIDGSKAIDFADKGILLCEQIKFEPRKYDLLLTKGKTLILTAKYNESINLYNQCLVYFNKQKNIKKQASVLGALGVAYWLNGLYDKSSAMHYKSLKIYEELRDTLALSDSYNNLGLVFKDWGAATKNKQYLIKANTYFFKALTYADTIHNNYQTASAYNNIGSTFINMSQLTLDKNWLKRAEYFLDKSLQIKMILGNNRKIAINLSSLGSLYFELKQFPKALNFFNRSYNIHRSLEDSASMALVSINIGNIYQTTNKLDKAIEMYLSGIAMAKQVDDKADLLNLYESISICYALQNKFKEAFKYHVKFTELKENLISSENSEKLAEMSEKFESEKKGKENKLLQTENKLSTATIKQQKTITYFIIGGLFIVSGLAFFIFNGLKKQKKAFVIISKQKEEVHRQKEIIEEHQKETIDSINYAKRIQYALLANNDLLKRNLNTHFVLFKPKDIVSGDFYWATEHNNKFYLAVCDCTGHGVPGAFMSLLNIGFLSEAIKEKNIEKPNEVFNYVRARLINSISNDGQQDGMDGILLCFDKTLNQISYAASNNEPVLVSDNNVIELPKDKMPVGKGEKAESFTLFTINAAKGDTLYLYTDGYADQFGGPKGKKFKYKQLNELLFSLNNKSMEHQKDELNSVIQNWKGNLEQVDDILMIGIKI